MAIPTLPTFSAGEILTSSVMNDVSTLGNYQGLFHIKTQTIGNAVSSVTVTGAFSSDFDHYKIIVQVNSIAAGGPYMTLQLGSTTTGYYWGAPVVNYAAATASAISTNNGSSWNRLGPGGTTGMAGVYDVLNPFLSVCSSTSCHQWLFVLCNSSNASSASFIATLSVISHSLICRLRQPVIARDTHKGKAPSR